MSERETSVTTPDGRMPTFVVSDEAPRAVIVMLMDGRGIREPLRDQARRLAAAGYYVMLPNLFYRHIGQGETQNVADMSWMTELNSALTAPRVTADVEALLAAAAVDPIAPKGGPAGLIGYCMGARLSVVMSQTLGPRIAAVAAFHPGYMATRKRDSPHLSLDRITAEIYLATPEHDEHLSPGAAARLEEAFKAAGLNYAMEVIPGATHGFTVPGNEQYQAAGAEHVWAKALDLFGRAFPVRATAVGAV
jgi:carboxymethylenebutenolidase